MTKVDVLVVGAGFAGCVMAERLANVGREVVLIDRREHIGGNAYDEYDDHGVLVHRYGPHIFHTNAERVVDYLSRFTDWRAYEHRVLASVDGQLLPVPVNRTTINRFYALDLDEAGVREFLDRIRESRHPLRTSEDAVLNSVGRDLCEKMFRGYTRKQWGLDLSELSATVAARIPVRANDDDRYFTDRFQLMPRQGYSSMFERMLDHRNISVEVGTDFHALRNKISANLVIYTGPVDAYFDFCFGRLPYRSIRFEHEHFARVRQHQPVATINYPNDHDFTRITEFKQLTGQEHSGTSIVKEYPVADGDPYYPVPRQENEARYRLYKKLAAKEKKVVFIGRLAQYRYYNMDQVVAAALKVAARIAGDWERNLRAPPDSLE